MREGAGCDLQKPLCQVPDSQMNIPGLGGKLIKDLIKEALLTHRLLYFCCRCLFSSPLTLLLFPWHLYRGVEDHLRLRQDDA